VSYERREHWAALGEALADLNDELWHVNQQIALLESQLSLSAVDEYRLSNLLDERAELYKKATAIRDEQGSWSFENWRESKLEDMC
jgi:hypothetical protein